MTHAGRILGIASVLLHLAVASAAQAQSCPHQGLASFGPISAATFGYPAYYVDQNGQGLGQCLDPANPLCGLPPLPDPFWRLAHCRNLDHARARQWDRVLRAWL